MEPFQGIAITVFDLAEVELQKMKNLKWTLILAIATATAPLVYASGYDNVGLVLDNTGANSYQVDRYDLTTGQSLGSFAAIDNTTYTDLGIQEVGNTTHVFSKEDKGIIYDKAYNMQTGQLLANHEVGDEGSLGNVTSLKWIPGMTGNGAYLVESTIQKGGGVNLFDTDHSSSQAIVSDFSVNPLSQLQFDSNTSTIALGTEDTSNTYVNFYDLRQSTSQLRLISSQTTPLPAPVYNGNGFAFDSLTVALNGSSTPLSASIISDYTQFTLGSSPFHFGEISGYIPSTSADSGSYVLIGNSFDSLAYGSSNNLYELNVSSGKAHIFSFNASPGAIPQFSSYASLSGVINPLDFAVNAVPTPPSILVLAPFALGLITLRRRR